MACYFSSIPNFIHDDPAAIVGELALDIAKQGYASQYSLQMITWKKQIHLLQSIFQQITITPDIFKWHIAFEYEIPRRQKRPDVILISTCAIFVIEFKYGHHNFSSAAKWQTLDYALNIRDFHEESKNIPIFPVLCATEAIIPTCSSEKIHLSNHIAPITLTNAQKLKESIEELYRWGMCTITAPKAIDAKAWIESNYRPTLSIIEAAEQAYENKDIREISHSFADNLDITTDSLAAIISWARKNNRHAICFVTGIPGAGKTLAGLNIVHDPKIRTSQGNSGTFLSGNGPLVKVLKAAIIEDQKKRKQIRLTPKSSSITAFIENVHVFMRTYRASLKLPLEHVVIFDEAQRAWDAEQMHRKEGVDKSEPQELLEIMSRFDDWSVVIALVGGGQEIFSGEAGLKEWGRAIELSNNHPRHWHVFASPEVLIGGESVAKHKLFVNLPSDISFYKKPELHLSVNVRSHRAQKLAVFVNALLEFDIKKALEYRPSYFEFPIVMTRELNQARQWLQDLSQGDKNKRCGLVSSSEDQRLRYYGIENSSYFRRGYPFDKWFLNDINDKRSSYALEVSASEFECQGLELDLVGICWGGDLLPNSEKTGWQFRNFRGKSWQNNCKPIAQTYALNRYRVLLTRARLGFIIWIPKGIDNDCTLDRAGFDRLYEFLTQTGIPDIDMQEGLYG